tara:strand:- start:217 stop:375 length:159 start_codon:yes stop_codon:yes gene_type:complete
MTTPSKFKPTHIAIAALVVLGAVLAYFLWQESRTERVQFSIGDQTIEVEAEG